MLDEQGVMMEVAKAHGFRVLYEDRDRADELNSSHWTLLIINPKNGRELSVIQSFPSYDNHSFETWGTRKRQPKAHQDFRTVLRRIVNLR